MALLMQNSDNDGNDDSNFEAVSLSDHFEPDSTDDDSSSGSYSSDSSFNNKHEAYDPTEEQEDIDIVTELKANDNDNMENDSFAMGDIDGSSVSSIFAAQSNASRKIAAKRYRQESLADIDDEIFDEIDNEPPKKKARISVKQHKNNNSNDNSNNSNDNSNSNVSSSNSNNSKNDIKWIKFEKSLVC